ncbi:TPA: hypothetical protein ACH3X1_005478 [Trebouxia sp. C0004]
MTQKDQVIKAKDEQLADLRAQQDEQATLLADAQQALRIKERLLVSIINKQAGTWISLKAEHDGGLCC